MMMAMAHHNIRGNVCVENHPIETLFPRGVVSVQSLVQYSYPGDIHTDEIIQSCRRNGGVSRVIDKKSLKIGRMIESYYVENRIMIYY